MKPKELINKKLLNTSVNNFKLSIKQRSAKVITKAVNQLFKEVEGLQAISWIQHTSVYNDETYEFQIEESIQIKLDGLAPTSKDDRNWIGHLIGDGFTMYSTYETCSIDKKVKEILNSFIVQLHDMSDELNFAFGSSKITIYRNNPIAEIIKVSDAY